MLFQLSPRRNPVGGSNTKGQSRIGWNPCEAAGAVLLSRPACRWSLWRSRAPARRQRRLRGPRWGRNQSIADAPESVNVAGRWRVRRDLWKPPFSYEGVARRWRVRRGLRKRACCLPTRHRRSLSPSVPCSYVHALRRVGLGGDLGFCGGQAVPARVHGAYGAPAIAKG